MKDCLNTNIHKEKINTDDFKIDTILPKKT